MLTFVSISITQGLLCPPESGNYFQFNLCCPTFLSPSTVNPTLPPPSTVAATTSAPSFSYPGFVARQLCPRLACLPPDRTETVGDERAPLPLLELCMCCFIMYMQICAKHSILSLSLSLFLSPPYHFPPLGHPPPTTTSIAIARRLYDSPTWSSEGRANEERKTKER